MLGVAVVAEGYPGNVLPELSEIELQIFHVGMNLGADKFVRKGGRVLIVAILAGELLNDKGLPQN